MTESPPPRARAAGATRRGTVAPATRARAVRHVLLAVLVLNGCVAAIKVVIGLRTGALAVVGAGALESALDMFNNVLGMILVSVASRAADEDHPYGHGKFETLGALAIVGFLSISCFELLRAAITSMATGWCAPRGASGGETALLAATLVLSALVAWYERRRGRALGSAYLIADAAHTRGDVLVTLLALVSLWSLRLGAPSVDAGLAIVVALLIAWSGVTILRKSIPVLVDERAIDAAELARAISSVPEVREIRSIRSRSTSGGQLFVEATIAVAGATSVERAHELADAVEAAIEAQCGPAEVLVHIEPA